jgi:glycopeptide antibiotics resistance protein
MQELSGNQPKRYLDFGQIAEVDQLWRRVMWLSALFVVYGSLVPLQFQSMPWDVAVDRFSALLVSPPPAGSRVDLASNVLLPMPLAFAAAQVLLAGRSGMARYALRFAIVLCVLLLAMLVEFLQQFFPPRALSLTDIQAQTVGGVVALLAQWRWGETASAWLAGWWQRERAAQRVERALKAYLLVLLGFSVLPLDLTINPVEIYHKWSQGRVVWWPFAGLKGGWDERLYEILSDVAIWVPVGVLLGLGRRRSVWQVLRVGLLAALLIETAQLFVFSRVTDLTDVWLAGVGTSLGAELGRRWAGVDAFAIESVPAARWAWLGWLWLAVVLTVFWYPFSFGWPGTHIGWAWLRVPFATYQVSDEFHAVNEVLRRVGFFLPGGLFWGLYALSGQRSTRGVWWVVAVALVVEAGQVFQPGKVADITDAALAMLGGWLGWRLACWLIAPVSGGSSVGEDAPLLRSGMEVPPVQQLKIPSLLVQWPVQLLVLTFALVVVVRLPGVPYNVRELVAVGPWGAVSAFALAACLYLVYAAPLWPNGRTAAASLASPLVALVCGSMAFLLLRLAVPVESLHDIVGSPVWGWPWEWELLLRFVALWTAVFLVVGLAGQVVATVLNPGRLAVLISGALLVLVLIYPLYWLIVRLAATDNLTELLAREASVASFAGVLAAIGSLAVAGGCLAVWVARPVLWRRLLPWLLFSLVVSPLGLLYGLQSAVFKYGKVFSALQFLLSAQRDAYVQGGALWLRFAGALLAVVLVVAVLQYPAWRRFALSQMGREK